MTQLYVDLDGTLADFDAGYAAAFGRRPDKAKDDVDWGAVRAYPNFYANLPPMPDLVSLWQRIARYQPIVLTGVPRDVPEAASNKLEWVKRWLPPGTLMIPTRSSEKATYARPGDVLIDDWERYRQRWLDAGGIWITYTGAADVDRQLTMLGL